MKIQSFFARKQSLFLYGISLAVLLFLLQWLQIRLVLIDHAFELYAGSIAIVFTAFGIWLALKLSKPKTIVVEKEVAANPAAYFVLNETVLNKLGISKRELEVLQLMADGHSNQAIADRLFVSLNTIKTHSSNLFEKLDVKSRTQAISKAKAQGLIP